MLNFKNITKSYTNGNNKNIVLNSAEIFIQRNSISLINSSKTFGIKNSIKNCNSNFKNFWYYKARGIIINTIFEEGPMRLKLTIPEGSSSNQIFLKANPYSFLNLF